MILRTAISDLDMLRVLDKAELARRPVPSADARLVDDGFDLNAARTTQLRSGERLAATNVWRTLPTCSIAWYRTPMVVL